MLREEQQCRFTACCTTRYQTRIYSTHRKSSRFSFINELLADSYCKNNGRPAKEPEMMMKLLFEHIYGLSDVVMKKPHIICPIGFLGMNPEDELPDPAFYASSERAG